MSDLSLYISFTSLIISIIGWFVVHFLSRTRDSLNKKKGFKN